MIEVINIREKKYIHIYIYTCIDIKKERALLTKFLVSHLVSTFSADDSAKLIYD